MIAAATADRFWAKVDRSGGPDACWPWTASRNVHGYGKFSFDGVVTNACRVAWILTNHPLADPAVHVRHNCGSRLCCNPAHLFAGSPIANARDGINGVSEGARLLRAACQKSSQLALANAIRVSRSTIACWMSERNVPSSLDCMLRIDRATNGRVPATAWLDRTERVALLEIARSLLAHKASR